MNALWQYYWQSQLLLLLSLAFFYVGKNRGLRWRRSYKSLVRAAQVLLLASLVLPGLLPLVPQKHLSHIQFTVVQPLSESIAKVKSPPRPEEHTVVPAVVVKNAATSAFRWDWRMIPLFLLFGSLFLFLRLFFRLKKMQVLLKSGLTLRRIGKVTVLLSENVTMPFSILFGRRAYVVLPQSLLAESRDFKIALLHELQHHRSGDTLWAFYAEIFLCLFYANPAVYFWKKELMELQEFSCDEALIGQRRVSLQEYGSCLVRVAEAALGSRDQHAGTACMAAGSRSPRYFKSFLRRRIEMFAEHKQSRGKISRWVVLGTVGLLAAVTVAVGAEQSLSKPNPGHAAFEPNVQSIAEDVLQEAVKNYGAKAGFVLVADPWSGKILGVASVSQDPALARKNWALSYRMEPASVMKGIVAAAALEQKLGTLEEKINCENDNYEFGGRMYHDWKGFQELSFSQVVEQSSNIGGIKIGDRLGANRLRQMLKDFGFGPGGSTADFPEAMPGEVPETSQLSGPDYIAMISTGITNPPGFSITPLEILQSFGAIANDGKLMKPVLFNDGASVVVRQVLSTDTAEKMKRVLQKTVTEGIAREAQSKIYSTAGKTSSAFAPDSSDHDRVGGQTSLAGFVGFAPVEHPRVVVYVGIINPTDEKNHHAHGNRHAAPVFRRVAERVLQYMQVEPDLGK